MNMLRLREVLQRLLWPKICNVFSRICIAM